MPIDDDVCGMQYLLVKRTRPGNPKIAIAYLRVSTDEQRLGPEAQRATIEAWAAREGVTVAAWHADQGVSGGSEIDDRPGLVAALAELRTAHAGVFVTAKRDRIARDVAVAAMIDKAVGTCGAKVVSADGVGNGSSPADGFMRSILDAAAAYERELIRARTKAALAAKRAKGERAGECPYGWTADVEGRLSEDPAEQAVLSEVRRLRAEGLSLRRIVAELGARGMVSRARTPLGLTQIARMVRAA